VIEVVHKWTIKEVMPNKVGSYMLDKSRGRGETKYSPWSAMLGVGRGTDNPIPEKSTVNETSRAYGAGQDPHSVVAPVKKKKENIL
jgi:hypothetical protein